MNLKQLLLGRSFFQCANILIIISESCVNQLDEVEIKKLLLAYTLSLVSVYFKGSMSQS